MVPYGLQSGRERKDAIRSDFCCLWVDMYLISMCSLEITITTHDIFQCLKANLSAVYYCTNCSIFSLLCMVVVDVLLDQRRVCTVPNWLLIEVGMMMRNIAKTILIHFILIVNCHCQPNHYALLNNILGQFPIVQNVVVHYRNDEPMGSLTSLIKKMASPKKNLDTFSRQ